MWWITQLKQVFNETEMNLKICLEWKFKNLKHTPAELKTKFPLRLLVFIGYALLCKTVYLSLSMLKGSCGRMWMLTG